MADFRGLHGFGYDESAWIGTAFDVGLMLSGPFTVYLGGLMGPRRILLHSRRALHYAVYLPPPRAQLQSGDCNGASGRLTSGHVLSTHAHVSSGFGTFRFDTIPFTLALYAAFVDRRGEHRAFALRLVQRTIFLRIGCYWNSGLLIHARDDDLYLLRDT